MRTVRDLTGTLNDEDTDWLAQHGDLRVVPRGVVVMRPGEQVDASLILVEGKFAIKADGPDSPDIATVYPGEILGEYASIEGRQLSAVVSVEDSRLFVVDKKTLATKLTDDHAFAARFERYRTLSVFLADRLRRAVARADYRSWDDEAARETEIIADGSVDAIRYAVRRFDKTLRWLRRQPMSSSAVVQPTARKLTDDRPRRLPQGVTVLLREQSDQLYFVYTGLTGRLMTDPRAFFQETRLFDRNIVMFRDLFQSFYQKGISAQLNTFDAFLEWQVAFRQQQQPRIRQVFCIGTSMGGYAALLCGHLLGVDEVWAFSPLTIPRADVIASVEIPPERRDLAVLLSRWNGRTRYNVVYNASSESDAVAAESLAACQGVTLRPQAGGGGHNVVGDLYLRGELHAVLGP
jgi:CRP-like cAMP-binding protein